MVDSVESEAPVIRSVEDLLAVLAPVTADGREFWYRGHRNVAWTLEASTFRSEHHRAAERAMLARFDRRLRPPVCSTRSTNGDGITFAQHHELPTRLLDWSQSPLVALFFACEPSLVSDQPLEDDGEFFVLEPAALNREAGDADGGHPRLLSESESRLNDYLPGKDADNPSKPRAVVAPMLFDRIRFQTGTFTVEQRPAAAGSDEPLRKANALQSFVVAGDSKAALAEQLDSLGFNASSIYRDLDRIARRIKGGRRRGAA